MDHHLAQFNIARLRVPLELPENHEFVAALDTVNELAEANPGFVWRLTADDNRSASYVQVYDDPLLIVNLPVWTDLESLRHFTYRSGHVAYLRRRREWFEPGTSGLVCWWVPADSHPSVSDATARLEQLEENGPTASAFTLSDAFEPDRTR